MEIMELREINRWGHVGWKNRRKILSGGGIKEVNKI